MTYVTTLHSYVRSLICKSRLCKLIATRGPALFLSSLPPPPHPHRPRPPRLGPPTVSLPYLTGPPRGFSGMDIIPQFDQDVLQPGLSQMDTTPILQSLSDEIYIPAPHPELVHPNMLVPQEQNTGYLPVQAPSELSAGAFDPAMHLSLNDLPMPVFMPAAMDTLDPLSSSPFDMGIPTDPFAMVASTPSEPLDLSPDARALSVSPVQSQVPSPSILGTSSPYGPIVTSSLDSALEPIPTHPVRSRANTSVSPPSFLASTPPGIMNAAPDYPTTVSSSTSSSQLEESVSQQQPQTLIGRMLKE